VKPRPPQEGARKEVLEALFEAWDADPTMTFGVLISVIFDPIPSERMDEIDHTEVVKLIHEARDEIRMTQAVQARLPKNFNRLSPLKQLEVDDEIRRSIKASAENPTATEKV